MSEEVEFYVGYQKYSVSEKIYEKMEGTALDAVLSGRHCETMLFGLPKIDRPMLNFVILMDFLESGNWPKDRKERMLLC